MVETMGLNGRRLMARALIALIVFIVAAVAAVTTRTYYAVLISAGLALLAASLLWL